MGGSVGLPGDDRGEGADGAQTVVDHDACELVRSSAPPRTFMQRCTELNWPADQTASSERRLEQAAGLLGLFRRDRCRHEKEIRCACGARGRDVRRQAVQRCSILVLVGGGEHRAAQVDAPPLRFPARRQPAVLCVCKAWQGAPAGRRGCKACGCGVAKVHLQDGPRPRARRGRSRRRYGRGRGLSPGRVRKGPCWARLKLYRPSRPCVDDPQRCSST